MLNLMALRYGASSGHLTLESFISLILRLECMHSKWSGVRRMTLTVTKVNEGMMEVPNGVTPETKLTHFCCCRRHRKHMDREKEKLVAGILSICSQHENAKTTFINSPSCLRLHNKVPKCLPSTK